MTKQFELRDTVFEVRTLRKLLINLKLVTADEFETMKRGVEAEDIEARKQLGDRFWAAIETGSEFRYGGYKGYVISKSGMPWYSLCVQVIDKKGRPKGVMKFDYLNADLYRETIESSVLGSSKLK